MKLAFIIRWKPSKWPQTYSKNRMMDWLRDNGYRVIHNGDSWRVVRR